MKRLSLDEVEGIPVFGTLVWKPVRKTLGVTAFGINAYTAANAGDEVVEEHTESQLGHEEIYAVVAGHAVFTVDGETVDAPTGTVVYLDDPAERRSAVAQEPGTTVLAIGGVPGRHEVSAWEYFFPALPHMRSGDYDTARRLLEEGLAEQLAAVRAVDDVHLVALVLEPQMREQQPHLVAVAGDRTVVEKHAARIRVSGSAQGHSG